MTELERLLSQDNCCLVSVASIKKALEQESCENAISRQTAIDIVRHECGEWKGLAKEIVKQFNGLPPVQPKTEIKPIGYRECSDAMLKMWMDNVLTDGEYYRIMDKLNAKWSKMNEVEA